LGAVTALVEVEDLFKFFHTDDDEVRALREVSLTAGAGEMIAIEGPSGSGKSTLLGCIAGLDNPDAGWVRVVGKVVSRRTEAERVALRGAHVGMLFQTGNLFEHLTVAENIDLAQRLVRRRDRSRTGRLLEQLVLSHRAQARPDQLSGGEAARAGLAVALANAPEVLLADEPTGELDAATQARVLELIRNHVSGGGAALVVTHSPDVAAAADRRLRLRDGRIER
jgi:putative ABC transport system ATP-binding protein